MQKLLKVEKKKTPLHGFFFRKKEKSIFHFRTEHQSKVTPVLFAVQIQVEDYLSSIRSDQSVNVSGVNEFIQRYHVEAAWLLIKTIIYCKLAKQANLWSFKGKKVILS